MTKLINNKSQRRKICKCLYNKRNNELIIDFIYFIVIKIYIENYIKNIYFSSIHRNFSYKHAITIIL